MAKKVAIYFTDKHGERWDFGDASFWPTMEEAIDDIARQDELGGPDPETRMSLIERFRRLGEVEFRTCTYVEYTGGDVDDYLVGDLEMAKVDQSLVGGIGIEPGYAAYEATTQYDSVGSLHIVYSDTARRAGIVYVGSGSSGATSWTDADSVEDALRRYLDDEMSN